MTVDVIDLTGRTLGWEKVLIDVDRTARPLTIVGGTFTGPGVTSEGIFFLGLNAYTAYVTMTGQTFDGVLLAKAGVFEVRSGDFITLSNMRFRNLRRAHTCTCYTSASYPYHSWAGYISGQGRPVRSLWLDDWTLEPPAIWRDLSAIQEDSSSLTNSDIRISNIVMAGYDYAFYENVKTTNLVLDTWDVTDTGQGGMALSFHQASGWYRDISLVGSGGIVVNSSGMVPVQ